MKIQTYAVLAGCTVLAAGGIGCANKLVRKSSPANTETTSAQGAEDAKNEPSVRNMVLHAVAEVKPVHFQYDSSFLQEGERAILRRNAGWLRDHAEVHIQVAGNCDQRGTEAYNLALGQRRAQAVRSYYKMLGVSLNRVATISYGKEKPLCADMNEACWSQNRRAETLIAYPETLGSAK